MQTPKITPQIKPYLTIIESRNPNQKLHSALGHAKNAFDQSQYYLGRWGQLYEYRDGEWILLYDIPKPEITGYDTRYGRQPRYSETRPWRLFND